ncbi:unnamed protein product [Sphenostylis stenocarpa]|uniref:Uncharacterized protein n=1 Tax=Sphenostylis stenocarpa TaxID=92480 RepID=A0AA86V3B7_9FABA|nr:unnamed protein product [Sphenostylis stenocarpa]
MKRFSASEFRGPHHSELKRVKSVAFRWWPKGGHVLYLEVSGGRLYGDIHEPS